MIVVSPECSAGLQTGCSAGVLARAGPRVITKSYGLDTGRSFAEKKWRLQSSAAADHKKE
jgi:hypothetical protein